MALAEHPGRGLAHHGEGFDQHVVEVFAVGETGAELVGLGPELGVAQRRHLVGEVVDRSDQLGQLADAFALAGLQNLLKYTHVVFYPTGPAALKMGCEC